MKAHPIPREIQVTGGVVLSVVNVMGAFRSLALRILEKNGIVDPRDEGWYSLRDWLNSFETIVQEVGPNTLYQIGRQISSHAPIPPPVDTLAKALDALDEAYQGQHRGGVIGNYHYISTGERSGTMICTTPYPSDFDRGVLQALVERFEPDSLADVQLDPQAETRMNGDSSCTFLISW